MTRRGALASSRVMLFNRFTRRSGRGVTTGLGPSLQRYIHDEKKRSQCDVCHLKILGGKNKNKKKKQVSAKIQENQNLKQFQHHSFSWSPYLTLRTLQALHFPVRWLRTTENSTSSPVWSSRPSCTSFTWKNSFLLSPTSYVMKPNWEQRNNFIIQNFHSSRACDVLIMTSTLISLIKK